jgi:hypothetical protein
MTAEAPASTDGADTGTSNGNSAGPHSGGRLRASDTERAAAVDVLQDAVARGLLTHDEGGERMASALGAKFRDELPPLTADLPPAPPPPPTDPIAIGWRRLGSTTVAQVRSDVRAAAAAGPRSRRFLLTALVGLLVIGFLIATIGLALNGLFDGGGYGHHGGFHHHYDD